MPIEYIKEKEIWVISTRNTAYSIGLGQGKKLYHIYWGKKLISPEDYTFPKTDRFIGSQENINDMIGLEYPGFGGINYVEPCLKVKFFDGVRELDLEYVGFAIYNVSIPELIIELRDTHYGLAIQLHYRIFEEYDLIERFCDVINASKENISIDSVQSAAWHVPVMRKYRLSHLSGKWVGETQLMRSDLTQGKKILESRRGFTSNHANPWFALDVGNANEEYGEVWFGALGWSGNWKIAAEVTPHFLTRVTGGIHDFDFKWLLKPGDTFTTPVFVGGYTDCGFGEASRKMHQYQINEILPKENSGTLRKILYNSWEATYFDVSEEGQAALAQKAALIGVELFVVDDGWFGKRDSDNAALGDWYVNPKKFPKGLTSLVDKVNALGMDFGIWVEPEMVNPDSDLYRVHPDWVLHYPNRHRSEARSQLVLNLAKKEVQDYIYNMIDTLLSENNIKFIKWDFNRPISEAGWPEASSNEQQEIWVRYVQGLYDVIDNLRNVHPNVVFESCASGGGRVDLGILKRTDQVWTSDNTNAFDRLLIQEGFSYAYCSKIMMAWVTESPNWINGRSLSLKYRFHSAMMGSLGIGGDLNRWSKEELIEARELIETYKEIRHIVQDGLQYRLQSLREGNLGAVQYNTHDGLEAVIFVMLYSKQFGDPVPLIYPKGLCPNIFYYISGEEGKRSGQALMYQGIFVNLNGDFDSIVLHLKAEK